MKKIFLIFIASFLIFYPSLFGFYTNDDFFHLKISHATTVSQFLNFFNLEKGSSGQLLYRPLTTHVFYFLGWQFFNLNPIGLHVVSFILFFITIYTIYKLALLILENEKVALVTAFLYSTSASHFGHLYYLATEVVLAVFFFPSVLFFASYLKTKKIKFFILSIIFFVFSLLAKENSVILPGVYTLLFLYFYFERKTKIDVKTFLVSLIPSVSILAVYLYFHFFYYGFVRGDSYIWNLSPVKAANTALWYGLWSLNLPEMLVDFVGPGIHINPNLFLYWSKQIIPILVTFLLEIIFIVILFIKSKILNKKFLKILIFSILWYILTLSPILFLPLHKFTFYLTLPLFSVVLSIGYLLQKKSRAVVITFGVIWTVLSVMTLKLTVETNWITQGEAVAKKAYDYINLNKQSLDGKTILFYDSTEDKQLPFSPTETLKNTLSDNNFFDVFYSGNIKALYGGDSSQINAIKIRSRMFLGY